MFLFKLLLYGRSLRFRRMKFVEVSIEPLVNDVVARRHTHRGDQTERDRNSQRIGVNAAKEKGKHDTWNNEDVLRTVIETCDLEIISKTCLREARLQQKGPLITHHAQSVSLTRPHESIQMPSPSSQKAVSTR